MKNKWTVVLVVFALLFGMVMGSAMFPRTKYLSRTIQPQNYPEYIQILSQNGFHVENRSMENEVWIATETFDLLIDLATYYGIKAIYCSVSIYGKIYFWFPYQTNQAIRWDIP